ncbi:UbiA prenyltransferase family-domain-containing protein [Xylariaceae sp. FL0016]|nr:UbiA prenyltransferase family-domain-containing protein [Xylariaceae sp. FL0016]
MNPRPAGNVFRFLAQDSLCWRCSGVARSPARSFFHTPLSRRAIAPTSSRWKAGYFVSNGDLPRLDNGSPTRVVDQSRLSSIHTNQDLPHRRRQRETAQRIDQTNTSPPPQDGAAEAPLPPDASSALTTASTKQPPNSLRRQMSLFLSLSKPRLTVLVVLTAMVPYALYPVPAFMYPTFGLDTPSLSPLTLAFLTTGTALCSASANTLNMLYEQKWDAMMSRTRNRPLVRGLLSQRKALTFAVVAAFVGVGSLYFGVNPTVAFLGAANIALYAGVYTPLKRVSWLNTWIGAIVGGIPPLMGWAAAAGETATGDGSFRELLGTTDAIGGWLFASLLFAWQFPHFMALSWSIREEYKAAGYRLLCWVNPARNARVALRYSLAFVPICVALCATGVTEWSFAVTSLPVNFWLGREAVRFWQHQGFQGSARGLFWASVWHLPAVMMLALVQKKGMWGRVWRSIVGEPDLEDEDVGDDDWLDDPIGETASSPAPATKTTSPANR